MGHKFADIAFSNSVKAVQSEMGSRNSYASMEGPEDFNDQLGLVESEFIAQRDSFYMASIGESGWPYVQHRGGPPGFMKILDEHTIGFADYSGNRQYVSVGNFRTDNRVSLFFMDYANRRRLKIFGRLRIVSLDEQETLAKLEDGHYRAQIERGMIITIEAFDWNCPQFITPRFSESEVNEIVQNSTLREEVSTSNKDVDVESIDDGQPVLGSGPLSLIVAGMRQLTPRVRAYQLQEANGKPLPEFEPGAHLLVPVKLDDGSLSSRHYSISSDPSRHDFYEIAVLSDENGRGGSQAIHRTFQLGTLLKLEQSTNHFPLHKSSEPALLIAGGIGITPLKAMAHALASRNDNFQLLYSAKNTLEFAYRDELTQAFSDRVRFFNSSEHQRLNVAEILENTTESTLIYVCGPNRLIDDVLKFAKVKQISRDRIKFELFE